VPLERVGEHVPGRVGLSFVDRVQHRVEHQRDSGERLHGAVVEEQREPAPLVLLRGDESLAEPRAFVAFVFGHD
jgi:hypothetical protein